MNLLALYESNCGGETIATENFVNSLSVIYRIKVTCLILNPLTATAFFHYFYWYFFSFTKSALAIIKSSKIDWVYTTTFLAAVPAILLRPFFTYKVAFHYHGSRIPIKPASLKGRKYFTQYIKYKFAKSLYAYLYKTVDIIILPSIHSMNSLGKPRSFHNRVVIIPNGVNLKEFIPLSKPKIASFKVKYGFNKKDKIVSYIGRLNEQKNIDQLLQGIKILMNRQKNYHILIVHPKLHSLEEHNYKSYLVSLSRGCNIIKKVHWVSDPQHIRELYGISDVVLLPSEIENFPMTMLEAWAMKRIFIGTKAGNMGSLLRSIDSNLLLKNSTPQEIASKIEYFDNLSKSNLEKILNTEQGMVRSYSLESSAKKIYKLLIEARN